MDKNKNFVVWIYSQGIGEYLDIWKNFLIFIMYFFSIGRSISSLVSPWKKDIVIKAWRGWRPIKSLQILLDNIFSRFMGLIVRLVVIFLGLAVLSATFLIGLGALIVWIVFPLAFIMNIVYLPSGGILPIISMALLLFFAVNIHLGYRRSTRKKYSEMDIEELDRHGVFERICNRLGRERNEIDINVFKETGKLNELLKEVDLNMDDYKKILAWETKYKQKRADAKKFWLSENLAKIVPIGRSWSYAYTVNLDKHVIDLLKRDPTEYRNLDLIGRKDQLDITRLVLERPVQNNVLLTGNPGIGKKTVIHYLARLVRENTVSGVLADKRIVIFELGEAISHAVRSHGNPEAYLRRLFAEAAYAGNVILVMENLEHYLGANVTEAHPDISNIINEYLELPTFQIIALSTTAGYHNLIEKQEGMVKFFDVVELSEPTEDETVEIMLQIYEKAEDERVIFTYKALKNIIRVANLYKWEFPLPERALDLMKEAMVYWRKENKTAFVTGDTVDKFVTLKTGIPMGKINKEEQDKLMNLENILHQRVIGQEEAINDVAEALRRTRSGIGNTKKPIGSFLFMGPTGVGKTETAKALAETYFGDENKMIRMDMSEYKSPDAIDRLIGSTKTNRKGYLINNAKDNPYSLLLLDEIEKAYPDILDIFLQILDEGFVTDVFGEKVNFRNMIIIATSNAGSDIISKRVKEGKKAKEIKKEIIDHSITKGIFKPEFLNRFNGVIFFTPLSSQELKSVAKLMLKKLSNRLKKEKNIEISHSDAVVEKIIKEGYNPTFGARSLSRYIEGNIEDILVKKLISGEIKKGENVNISL